MNLIFQSTLPAGGATWNEWFRDENLQCQSTLPAGGATPGIDGTKGITQISIHAPRGGSDQRHFLLFPFPFRISIHAPRGGSDDAGAFTLIHGCLFQSTLPAGGATEAIENEGANLYISIHAPRGGSDLRCYFCTEQFYPISIHAPRGGSDTSAKHGFTKSFVISIHAPRGGSDHPPVDRILAVQNISIHAPRGGSDLVIKSTKFINIISIHAPRGGSDSTVKTCSNDRIKRSTLREPHFLYSKNACFSPIFSMCATTSRTKNQRIIVSFGSYPGLAPMCFTLDWYRFPRL